VDLKSYMELRDEKNSGGGIHLHRHRQASCCPLCFLANNIQRIVTFFATHMADWCTGEWRTVACPGMRPPRMRALDGRMSASVACSCTAKQVDGLNVM
jgi:hypothetical protein